MGEGTKHSRNLPAALSVSTACAIARWVPAEKCDGQIVARRCASGQPDRFSPRGRAGGRAEGLPLPGRRNLARSPSCPSGAPGRGSAGGQGGGARTERAGGSGLPGTSWPQCPHLPGGGRGLSVCRDVPTGARPPGTHSPRWPRCQADTALRGDTLPSAREQSGRASPGTALRKVGVRSGFFRRWLSVRLHL